MPRRSRAPKPSPGDRPAARHDEESYADLLADLRETTRQAAIDGLPLAQVFDDLRLVLDLGADEELPEPVLRATALAWAETQQTLGGPGPYDGVPCTTPDEVESRLWVALGDTGRPPVLAVVVRARPHDGPAGVALREVDVLVGAARALAPAFSGPEEYVGLARRDGVRLPDRVVVLTAEESRSDEALATIADLTPPGGPTLVATVHDLRGHPEGALTALRELLAEPAD